MSFPGLRPKVVSTLVMFTSFITAELNLTYTLGMSVPLLLLKKAFHPVCQRSNSIGRPLDSRHDHRDVVAAAGFVGPGNQRLTDLVRIFFRLEHSLDLCVVQHLREAV